MSDLSDDKDFWKDLMGDDFEDIDFLSDLDKEAQEAAPDEPGDDDLDFGDLNIEVVGKNGETRTPGAGERPSVPAAQHAPRPREPKDDDRSDVGPKDFKINFDFDSEYENGREDKPIKRNRERRTGCLGGILYFVFVIAISLGLAAVAWVAATDVLALGKDSSVVEVTLPESIFREEEIDVKDDEGNVTGKETIMAADVGEMTDVLSDHGLIKYKWLFKIYADYSHAGRKVSAGTYELNTNYDYRALVSGMTASAGTKVEVEVTIPEGYTMAQIFSLLDENGVSSVERLQEAATNHDYDYFFLDSSTLGSPQRLEGYLFPDTYKFYVGDDPERVIGKLLTNFENKWSDEYSARAETLGYSLADIINIAAMIEKEAAGDTERSTIASVIYNRLDSSSFPCLQIDATIYYAMSLTGAEFSIDLDSPYNTYKCEGLPAGPIANPGMASIRAALYPEKTKYYYYALSTAGTHEFFTNGDSFQAFINSAAYGG